MKFRYTEPREVEIPNDKLPELVELITEKWHLGPLDNIHAEDLLNEAFAQRLIVLPQYWSSEDESFTQDELLAP